MPTSSGKDNNSDPLIPKGAPDYVSAQIPREKLPKDLQNIVDQDSIFDDIYDGQLGDSTESNLRYAAYANRLRTIMLSAHRYVAYTSDIGESFRPVAHPWLVRSAYGISWAYLIGDVSNEGWKAYKRNAKLLSPDNDQHMKALADNDGKVAPDVKQALVSSPAANAAGPVTIPALEDWKAVAAQRAVFQSIASMGLPAFTIHSIVKYSGKAFRSAKNTTVRTWGPIGVSDMKLCR